MAHSEAKPFVALLHTWEKKSQHKQNVGFLSHSTHKDWHQPAIYYSHSMDYGRLAPDFVEGLHLDSYTMTAFAEVLWEGCESLVNQIKNTENIARHTHLFTCLLVGLYMHYRCLKFSDEESQKAAFGYLNTKDFEVPYIALLPLELKDILTPKHHE